MIKRNRTWKIRSLPGYSLASRCTTDRFHVSLRTVTFCHGVLRSAHFITANYVSHFRRDCRGRFLNCQKICHGVHGYPGVLRLPIPFPCVAFCSRLSETWPPYRREHSVNAVLRHRFTVIRTWSHIQRAFIRIIKINTSYSPISQNPRWRRWKSFEMPLT